MQPVETTTPDGIDYGWVMQVTFAMTIVVGAPVVAIAAFVFDPALTTWNERLWFAIRFGALVWFVTAIGVFAYAKRTQE